MDLHEFEACHRCYLLLIFFDSSRPTTFVAIPTSAHDPPIVTYAVRDEDPLLGLLVYATTILTSLRSSWLLPGMLCHARTKQLEEDLSR